MIDIA